MYEPIWINPQEAEARGIKEGDIVRLFNERGSVLGGALVWERIMPGVVSQDHGARLDMIVAGPEEYIDRGGANNLISADERHVSELLGHGHERLPREYREGDHGPDGRVEREVPRGLRQGV